MAKIVWSLRASLHLLDIGSYIAGDSEEAAVRTIAKLYQGVDRLARLPYSGRFVPEDRQKRYREVLIGNYRVVYRVVGSECRILAVVHGRRNMRTFLAQLS